MTACLHCGQDAAGARFCCPGCAAAWETVRGLGLERYYERRRLDPEVRPPRPEEGEADVSAHVRTAPDGTARLDLMVDGLQCAACVWLIESVLKRSPAVRHARLNMTTRRLALVWDPAGADGNALVASVAGLGYRLVPFDPGRLADAGAAEERGLLRAMAVAGFASANVMLLSVAVWAGHAQGMGPATRDLMHWVSALVALPAIAYAARPFFRSAWAALSRRRTSMDVPISLGVVLVSAVSLAETVQGHEHAYFDGAVMLLFFLLVGRYLELRARGRARSAAEHLLSLGARAVTVLDGAGHGRVLPPDRVEAGMTVLVAPGERVPVDGRVLEGRSDLDTALLTGETVPAAASPGDAVFAGTLNLTAALTLRVTAVGEGTLLAEIVRLMEVAEQGRARYVDLAERVSRFYSPVVHLAALLTFVGWIGLMEAPWQAALLHAAAVLIITCPCALALAVPAVQVIASGRLMRQGVLLKSATALERLAGIDTVVFDKTGTLTEGRPVPVLDGVDPADLRLAASLAGASRHPLARALARAAGDVPVASGVVEQPGAGLVLAAPGGEVRLGSRRHVGLPEDAGGPEGGEGGAGPEFWLSAPGRAPVRFAFTDAPRADAAAVVGALRARGLRVVLLSGDRVPAVRAVAQTLGIADWHAACDPAAKVAVLERLAAGGARVLMVGDGLNDAPALSAALVSMSPSTAADVSQTAADVVFQGHRLAPVAEAVEVAARADRLVRGNFALALVYNLLTVPLAVAGFVTPLVAALAMSSSSLLVIANALRLSRRRARTDETDGRSALPDPDRAVPRPAGAGGVPVGAAVRAV
ncbi:heavy metal translocating P-type ATPase [Arenibaculum sp.]|uniref:heavy metal translocating P-type ATPase n=1 Tax=Arenibaculum sp. TaxID=2865862 RepID=UPI002E147714|nr:heavy metal translocating P-type ATPase [Arenibaculum sp.]